MAVLRPLKVVLTNYPEGQVEEVDVINNPEDESAGTRKVPFSRVLYIEQDDFREVPPKKFFRLSPGKEVRLRCAYFITCTEVVKDAAGDDRRAAVHLRPGDAWRRLARRPQGEGHACIGCPRRTPRLAEVRLYDRLFSVEDPEREEAGKTFLDHLNPGSLEVLGGCQVEPSLATAAPGSRFQFERLGYFAVDPDSASRRPGLQPDRVACATPGRGSPRRAGADSVGIPHHAVRPGTGRARNSVHRGILRRVSAQEDRYGNRPAALRPVAPDSPRDGVAARTIPARWSRCPTRSVTKFARRSPSPS